MPFLVHRLLVPFHLNFNAVVIYKPASFNVSFFKIVCECVCGEEGGALVFVLLLQQACVPFRSAFEIPFAAHAVDSALSGPINEEKERGAEWPGRVPPSTSER